MFVTVFCTVIGDTHRKILSELVVAKKNRQTFIDTIVVSICKYVALGGINNLTFFDNPST